MAPVLPDADEPEPKRRDPLFPIVALPVLNNSTPLTPAIPAFDVDNTRLPLVDEAPKPVVIDIRPPVDRDDIPEDNDSSPPVPLPPKPTAT